MIIKSVSIIVPCYNEKNTIGIVLDRLAALNLSGREKDVIVINDGSTDGTKSIVDRYAKQFRVVHQSRNQGKGAAVSLGVSIARGDCLIVQDADLEYNPQDILKLIARAEREVGEVVVYGARPLFRQKRPWWSYLYLFGGFYVTLLANSLFGLRLRDVSTCYRLIRTTVYRSLPLTESGFSHEIEVTGRLAVRGYRIVEESISYQPRSAKEGKKLRPIDGLFVTRAALRVFVSEYLSKLIHRYWREVALFCISITASLVVFSIIAHYNPARIDGADNSLTVLSKNIVDRHIYSDIDTINPFPHSAYTPLYPLAISPFVHHLKSAIVLNWLFHALVIVLTYRFVVRYFRANRSVAYWMCVAFALEPYHQVLSNMIVVEMLFATLMLLSVASFLRYLKTKYLSFALVTMFFLGLATLTRPTAQFLVLVPLVFVGVYSWGNWKRVILNMTLVLSIFLVVLFPWLYRNHRLYGSWSLSSLPAYQMINANMPHYFEWQEFGRNASEGRIFQRSMQLRSQASDIVGADLTVRYLDINEARPVTKDIIVPFIKEHWLSFGVFYLTQLPFQLVTDNWRSGLDYMTRLPYHESTTLSAALAAAGGNIVPLLSTFRSVGPHLIMFMLGKLYWISVYGLAFFGFVQAWRQKGFVRATAIVCLVLAIYFPFIALPYLEARYRFPGTPYLFALAIAGATALYMKWQMLRGRKAIA